MAVEMTSTLPPHNKFLDQVIRTPGRQPSPQPVHLSVPNGSHHRMLPDQSPGYVAPKFEGKEKQMEQGRCNDPRAPVPPSSPPVVTQAANRVDALR